MGEPSPKRKRPYAKTLKSNQNTPTSSSQTTDLEPFAGSQHMTEPTIDENIYPDATYQSYDEFEQKFNTWKSKHLHPFRVASSESLRTEEGTVSEKFKYRYVVYHCARYGVPRMRGEGKRPNQHYLPCSCTAMIRLNFNFHEQCLKLTSLETRHSNHTLDKDLYDKMATKEEKRKHATPKRRATIGEVQPVKEKKVQVKKEIADEGAESEHTASYSQSPVDFHNQTMPSIKTEYPAVVPRHVTPTMHHVPMPNHLLHQQVMAPAASTFQALQDIQRLQNQIVMNQMNAFTSAVYPPPPPFPGSAPWPSSSTVPSAPSQTASESSPQISPISSTVDENEAPKRFHSMEAVRPIPLRPSENSAFHQMIQTSSVRESPIPKAEIDSLLASASRMLLDVNLPLDVLQNRMKQLNNLISQWSH